MPSGGEAEFAWTEIRLEVPSAFEDLAVGLLTDEAPAGCAVESCDDGRVRLVAHVREQSDIGDVLREALTGMGCHDVGCVVGSLPNQDWMANWMESFVPIHVTRRVWVRPPWHDCKVDDGDVVVSLNPSMAFGTGHHESTRIVLGFVDERVVAGGTYLDLGCGSGILAIAALLLGAGRVALSEIDPDARAVARRELVRNGVEERAVWVHGPGDVADLDGAFVNITADVVYALLPQVAERLATGGWVAVSGILLEEASEIRERVKDAGLVVCDERRDGTWWGALLEKP